MTLKPGTNFRLRFAIPEHAHKTVMLASLNYQEIYMRLYSPLPTSSVPRFQIAGIDSAIPVTGPSRECVAVLQPHPISIRRTAESATGTGECLFQTPGYKLLGPRTYSETFAWDFWRLSDDPSLYQPLLFPSCYYMYLLSSPRSMADSRHLLILQDLDPEINFPSLSTHKHPPT
jgi:hypothetical protein